MEKIWLKTYPKNVPAEIDPHAFKSLVDMFEQNCDRFHDHVAYINLGSELTYGELETKSRHFATYLQQGLGLKKGDRVAIMLPNVLQYPVVMFGVLWAGLIVVNVNPLYTAPELVHQLKDSGAETIIVIANYAHVLEKALPQTDIKHVIVTEIGDLLGGIKSLFVNFLVKYIKKDRAGKKMVPAWNIPGAIPLKEALSLGKKSTFNKVTVTGEDIAFLQYTGGTTGISKGAILTHRNLVANIMQVLAAVGHGLRKGKEVIVVALPLYHVFSLTICALTFVDLGGKGILITDPRDIQFFIKELSKVPFSVFIGVNTLFNALLNRPEFLKLNFKSLRLSVGGGMAVQKAVAEKWNKVTGNYILEGYGLTEASPVVAANPTNVDRFTGSIGLPLPSTDVKVCDEEGNEVPLGQSGELWVKGPQVMRGYWKKEEETKNVLTADGWLKTGDIVSIDEKGFIYMVDRKKDMIIISGFNVYPNEVEDVIASHPGVLEVGVIGVPSPETGEAVKAFIVKRNPTLTEQEIIDYAHERLTRYKVPKIIEFRTELPKSNVGKILRRKLREL